MSVGAHNHANLPPLRNHRNKVESTEVFLSFIPLQHIADIFVISCDFHAA